VAPSPAPSSGRDSYGYTPEEVEAISPCLLPEGHPKRTDVEKVPVYFLPGGNLLHMPVDHWEITLEMSAADRGNTPISDDESLFGKWDPNDRGTSGWDDLVQDDDGYAYFQLTTYTATNTPEACRQTIPSLIAALGEMDRVLLSRVACPCTNMASCTCKPLSLDWMIDSGATVHITPSLSDFIAYEPYSSPEKVRTTSGTDKVLKVYGSGTVLIQHIFKDYKGI
jgi:hypothetical protein